MFRRAPTKACFCAHLNVIAVTDAVRARRMLVAIAA